LECQEILRRNGRDQVYQAAVVRADLAFFLDFRRRSELMIGWFESRLEKLGHSTHWNTFIFPHLSEAIARVMVKQLLFNGQGAAGRRPPTSRQGYVALPPPICRGGGGVLIECKHARVCAHVLLAQPANNCTLSSEPPTACHTNTAADNHLSGWDNVGESQPVLVTSCGETGGTRRSHPEPLQPCDAAERHVGLSARERPLEHQLDARQRHALRAVDRQRPAQLERYLQARVLGAGRACTTTTTTTTIPNA
jgi:hypothetical protein